MLSATSIAMASLKQTEGEQAALCAILLAALNQSRTEMRVPLSAQLASSARDLPQIWARCSQDILVHIDLIDTKSQIFSENRLDDLVECFDAADPILSEIESTTGFVLDPLEMINVVPTNHAIIEISRLNAVDRILIAFPHEIERRREVAALAETLPGNLSHVSVFCSLMIKGPNLDVDGAADISVGDLLLFGGASVSAAVMSQIGNELQSVVDGSYDFASGQFIGGAHGGGPHTVSLSPQGSSDSNVTGNSAAFPVRLTACISGFTVASGDLAATQTGSVLHLGKLLPGTNVTLSFGDSELCYGEWVQIADHFAVLVNKMKQYSEDVDNNPSLTGAAA